MWRRGLCAGVRGLFWVADDYVSESSVGWSQSLPFRVKEVELGRDCPS